MSEAIHLTVIEEVEVTKVSIIDETPINVNFYEVAVPDARIIQAVEAAQAAEEAAENAAILAQQAAENTNEAIDEAFNNKTTTDLAEGDNLYYTDARAKTATVIDSTSGSETDKAPSVSSIKAYADLKALGGSAGVHYFGDSGTDGSWRIYKDGASLKIQVRVSSVWTTIIEYNP